MASISNIKKYMIDNIEIAAYPTSVTPSINLVSKSWNNMYGVFKDVLVNEKLKLIWKYDYISEAELNTLMKQINTKILTEHTRFFNINSYCPGRGFISGTFYLGTPTTFESKSTDTPDGKPGWFSTELHWIEVDGIILNNTTAIVQ